jgi:hypothetical protein
MKKVLLGLMLTFAVLTANAQSQSGTTIMKRTSSQRMVWSDVDDKWLFFPLRERHYEASVWETLLNDNGTGSIRITNVDSEITYGINIYKWEMRTNDDGQQYIWIEGIQISDSQRLQVIMNSYSNGKMYTVFMPDSQLAIFFDNLTE